MDIHNIIHILHLTEGKEKKQKHTTATLYVGIPNQTTYIDALTECGGSCGL